MNFGKIGKTIASKFNPQRIMACGYRTYDCELYMGQLEEYLNDKPVKILSTRISTPGNESQIKKYLSELNKRVQKYDGFTGAESYWAPMTTNSLVSIQSRRMITISEWETRDAWKKWLNSKCRKIAKEDYKKSIESEEHITLENIPPPPIFLL